MRTISKKIHLKGFGDFYANAYLQTPKGILFVFDECVALRPMNGAGTNKGGFEASDLKRWMDTELLEAFPDNLRNKIVEISIPSIGELFGHKDAYVDDSFECDDDERLPVMHGENCKVSWYKGNPTAAWLKNSMKQELSKSFFATVSAGGDIDYRNASASLGVRPVFWLKSTSRESAKKVGEKSQLRKDKRYQNRLAKNSPELAEMLTRIENSIKNNGMSLKEAACQIGLHEETLYNWFNGRTAISAQSLLEVANIAGYELVLIDEGKEN